MAYVPMKSIALASFAPLALPLGLALVTGCSGAPSGGSKGEVVGSASAAIISGTASDASQDAVILLLHYDPSDRQGGFGECSGTMVAPNVVLTARHCVSQTDETAACGQNGAPVEGGGKIYRQHKANTLYVFTGVTRPDFRSQDVNPAGQGSQIFVPQADNLCNNDIALVVLSAPVAGAKIAPLRLEPITAAGETITSVGWGLTNNGQQPDQRMQRTGVAVDAVGPKLGFGANEFEVGESICSGDSGGPAFSEKSGAIIGVVSRGGNASNGSSPAAQCVGSSTRNIYTQTPPFKDLILQAFTAANATPILEEGSAGSGEAGFGDACAKDEECTSGHCLVASGDDGTCTEACEDDSACPDATTCNDDGLCAAKPKTEKGDDDDDDDDDSKKKNAADADKNASSGSGCNASGTPVSAFGLLVAVGLALCTGLRRVALRRRGS